MKKNPGEWTVGLLTYILIDGKPVKVGDTTKEQRVANGFLNVIGSDKPDPLYFKDIIESGEVVGDEYHLTYTSTPKTVPEILGEVKPDLMRVLQKYVDKVAKDLGYGDEKSDEGHIARAEIYATYYNRSYAQAIHLRNWHKDVLDYADAEEAKLIARQRGIPSRSEWLQELIDNVPVGVIPDLLTSAEVAALEEV